MKNLKKFKIIFVLMFILIEIIMGIMVQLSTGELLNIVCFSSVAISFVFSCLFLTININKLLLSFGLLMTVAADICLILIIPRAQALAMIFFSVTQICYFIIIFLRHKEWKDKIIHLIIRIFVIIIALSTTVLVLKKNTDFLSLISLFYYANLLLNVIYSFINKCNILFSIGLLCFALCDFCIGINIMDESYITIEEDSILYYLAYPNIDLAWLFYVPSQTLIALTNVRKDRCIDGNEL